MKFQILMMELTGNSLGWIQMVKLLNGQMVIRVEKVKWSNCEITFGEFASSVVKWLNGKIAKWSIVALSHQHIIKLAHHQISTL